MKDEALLNRFSPGLVMLPASMAIQLADFFAQFEPGPGLYPVPEARRRPLPPLVTRLPPGPTYDPHDYRAAALAYRDKMRSFRELNLPTTAGWIA